MTSKTGRKGTSVLRERSISESKDGNCVLCCEKAKYFAVGNCDHPVCFKCSARMRALSKQYYCAACRADMDQVVFCRTLHKFNEFDLKRLIANRQHGIRFEDKNIQEAFGTLLDYICNECGKKEKPFGSLQDLKTHIRKVHEKQFCQICIENLIIFPSELKVYTKKELVTHRRDGDKDEKSHRGHPDCRFCDDRFFDNDALLLHLRKNHFWCHFCEHDGKQDYYDVYQDLRRHFASSHYLCDEGNCFNEKFTSVYRDKIDYQAHRLAAHGKKLSKVQAKEARKVDIDYSFTKRAPKSNVISGADYEEVQGDGTNINHASGRGGRRGGGGGGSGHNRYHRDQRGKLNFYNYEDVEQDRKEFQGRVHRHEAEEIQNRNIHRVGLAASASLSSSEPDIHARMRGLSMNDSDDDVIGMPEHLNTQEERKAKKEQERKARKEEEKRKVEAAAIAAAERERTEEEARNIKEIAKGDVTTSVVDRTEEDFPTLPGASSKSFPAAPKHLTRNEAFPALGKPAKVQQQKVKKGPSAAEATKSNPVKSQPAHINGIPIVKAKKKGKGKSWTQQTGRVKLETGDDDFPELGITQKQDDDKKPKKNGVPPGFGSSNGTVSSTSQRQRNNDKKPNDKPPPPVEFKLVTNKKQKNSPPGFLAGKESTASKKNDGHDDFPELGITQKQNDDKKPKKNGVPPGLGSSNSTPVSSTSQNKSSGPPGLLKNDAKVVTSSNNSGPPGLQKTDTTDKNKMERNLRLLAMLQAYLNETSLTTFKNISGEFRRGLKTGEEYYRDISELLGDNLKYLFSELVALLPDETKQQELLFSHNNAKVLAKQRKEERVDAPPPDYTKKSTWGAKTDKISSDSTEEVTMTRCGDCGQTFPKDKALKHMESHSEKFPSLPTAVKKKKNYSFHPISKIQTVPVKNAWGNK